jgi:hypothetical protein
MMVGLVIYQFEPKNKKINLLRENSNQDFFENARKMQLFFSGRGKKWGFSPDFRNLI